MGLAVIGRPRAWRPAPVLVQESDPRALLEAVLSAHERGRAVAVLDAGWPQSMSVAAHTRLAAAASRLGGDDLVVFTSGSGGRPRAVHRSWESWRASVEPLARLLGLGGDDVTWLPGHPAATAPLYAAWHATQLGLPVRFAGEPHADATVVHAPPTLVPRVLRARQAGELPALRLVVTAGDRVPAALTGWCADAGVRLVSYYGAAELSFVAVRDDDRPGYRGFPGVELDVRDGLLWSRSPYQAHGYLDALGPTQAAALRRSADGWASVGDVARWVLPSAPSAPSAPSVPSEGAGHRVEILGRADQAITVSGHTALVEDIEHAFTGLPGVDELVVVGVPDRVHGARIVALWSGDPAATPPAEPPTEPSTDFARAAAALPAPARPRSWLRVDSLPHTGAGKPDRAAARELALNRLPGLGERA